MALSSLRYLMLVATVALTSSCIGGAELQAPPVLPSTSPDSVSPSISATKAFLEAWTRFERIVPGETTEEEVVKLLGTPREVFKTDGRVKLWYNPPRGWVILQDDLVVEITLSPVSLGEVVGQYGEPDRVIVHVLEGSLAQSTTYLLYPQHNIAVGISGEVYSFAPDLYVGGWRVAPGHFDEFVHREGLDGSSQIAEIKVISWAGFTATPAP